MARAHLAARTLARDAQSGNLLSATLQSLSTSYSFDSLTQLPLGRRTALGTSVLYDEQVSLRDEAGRILARTENVLGEEHRYDYTYDTQGRGGFFETANPTPGEPGYFGLSFGFGKGPPGVGSTTTDYTFW